MDALEISQGELCDRAVVLVVAGVTFRPALSRRRDPQKEITFGSLTNVEYKAVFVRAGAWRFIGVRGSRLVVPRHVACGTFYQHGTEYA